VSDDVQTCVQFFMSSRACSLVYTVRSKRMEHEHSSMLVYTVRSEHEHSSMLARVYCKINKDGAIQTLDTIRGVNGMNT
jgi:hypothetical protein